MKRLFILAWLTCVGAMASPPAALFSTTNEMIAFPIPKSNTNLWGLLGGFSAKTSYGGGVFQYLTNNTTTIDMADVFAASVSNSRWIRSAQPVGTNAPGALTVQGVLNGVGGYQSNGGASSGTYLRGNGTTYVPSALLMTDASGNLAVSHLNSGTSADNTHYWRGDGTWATVPSAPTGANFTASTGLSITSGTGTAALLVAMGVAVDQSFTPTWTGTHTFNNSTYSLLTSGGPSGFGVATPLAGVDIQSIPASSKTYVAAGSHTPVYITGFASGSGGPGLGFNLRYTTGWVFGRASSSDFGSVLGYTTGTGLMTYYSSSAAGNEDGSATLVDRLDITSGGLVGINSAGSVGARLHVMDDAGTPVSAVSGVGAWFQRSASSGANSYIGIVSGTTGLSGILLGNTSDQDEGLVYYDNSAHSLWLRANNADRLSISSGGVVNIPNLTASQFVKTDASKNLVSATISSTDIASATPTLSNAQVTGVGTDYTLTTSYARVDFGTTDPQVTLPAAGTYLVTAIMACNDDVNTTSNFYGKLYNSTDAADVASSERITTGFAGTTEAQIVMSNIITVAASKTIQVYAKISNISVGAPTIISVRTSISYVIIAP